MTWSRGWAHLRAALILFALVGSCVEGLPVPRIDPGMLSRPIGQRELTRWARILEDVGVEVEEPELRATVLRVSTELARWHDDARDPFRPFFELTRTSQRWSLFPVADPDPWWMHVEGRVAGTWTLLYRPNDPEHALLGDRLEYRRVRAVWNPGSRGPRAEYPRFVDWLAREVFSIRPDVEAVRVRYLRDHVSLPHEPARAETSWHFEERRERPREVTR